jgi:peptidoglycan/xylan/chitin deacetylase (PgdA/CDA1 family)
MQRAGVSSRVASSAWRRRRLLILCYHGIARFDEHLWNPGLYVSAAMFARRMELLRLEGCHVLPLAEAVDRLRRDDLPDRAVALTFDDGYVDFGEAAHPILNAHRFPATVYLPTLRVDHNKPIVALTLSYLLWQRQDRALEGRGLPGLEERTYSLAAAPDREAIVSRLMEAATRLGYSIPDKDELARQLAGRLSIDYDAFVARRMLTLLSPPEVTALAKASVDFQLHTHRHRSPNDPALLAREIQDNRERIEAMTGRPATHFCWPSGVYWREQLATLEAEGVETATTCDPGLATRTSPRLLLPRFVDTSFVDEMTFLSWVAGPAAWMSYRTAAGALSLANR